MIIKCEEHYQEVLAYAKKTGDKAGNIVMNGGIVYHGDPDESYSYTMNPTKGWQMHT